jgi:large subunit ribosomal protein L21
MYAIISTGGKQYRVSPGDILAVECLGQELSARVKFDQVLLVGGKAETDALVGLPYVSGASVEAEVVQEIRGDKLLIIKYRRRKGFRKTQGHRQNYTRLLITKLSDGKGSVLEVDTKKRADALMRASVPTAKKEAKAPKAAKAETAPKKAPAKKAAKKA